jgi:hypothetical protein
MSDKWISLTGESRRDLGIPSQISLVFDIPSVLYTKDSTPPCSWASSSAIIIPLSSRYYAEYT